MIRLGKQDGLFIEQEKEEIAAITWAGLHGMASLLQLDHKRQGLVDRPVGRAIRFLAEEQDQTLNLLLRSVLK